MRTKHYTRMVEHSLRFVVRHPPIADEASQIKFDRLAGWLNSLPEVDRNFLKVVYGKIPNIKYPSTLDGLKSYGGDIRTLYKRLDNLHRDFAKFNGWI